MSKQKYCDPAICDCCVYLGEGDFLCDRRQVLVVSDWCPTEDFCCCNSSTGKASAQSKRKTAKKKGGENMSQEKETRKYILKKLQTIYENKDVDWSDAFEEMSDFLGTALCDAGCAKYPECTKCALYQAMSTLKTEPTIESFNRVKQLVGCKIHELNGGK